MSEEFKKSFLNVVKENGKVIAFDIKRGFWGNGKNRQGGYLLSNSGAMCCLGFYSLACGLKSDDILDACMPEDVTRSNRQLKEMAWLNEIANKKTKFNFANTLARVNDEQSGKYKTEKAKEKRITKLFADNGIIVTFVD